jgi:hypothetical protein
MSGPQVWTFFYGSFMHPDVLERSQVVPGPSEVACLPGFGIHFQPLANLVPATADCAYGIATRVTHSELDRLYAHLATDAGGGYRPAAVLISTASAVWRPALCYLAPVRDAAPATPDYLAPLLAAARRYAFPDWYIRRLESATG